MGDSDHRQEVRQLDRAASEKRLPEPKLDSLSLNKDNDCKAVVSNGASLCGKNKKFEYLFPYLKPLISLVRGAA